MSFYTDVVMKDRRFTSTARVADPLLLEPILRSAAQAIMQEALDMTPSIRLMMFETYRSSQRQLMLFNQKPPATKLRIVGVHHYGLAVDLVKVNARGQLSWDGSFAFLGVLAKKHTLVWGGSWHDPVDLVHLQRCSLKDQEKLFAGSWYPDSSYNPLAG